MKKTIVLLIFFALSAPVVADEIHLNDGQVIRGTIIRITPENIEYDPEGDVPFDVFPRGQIDRIVYDNGKVVKLNEGKKAPGEREGDRVVAAYESPLTGFHRHDGFYARFLLGFGYAKTEIPDFAGGETLSLRGSGSALNLQFGYALMDNLILFLENGICVFPGAETELGNYPLTGSQKESDLSISTLGIGLSWYIMPANFYISPVLSYGNTTFDGNLIEGDSEGGLYLSLYLGKEFWVSANWGLGVAVFGMYGRDTVEVKSTGERFDLKNVVLGVLFSATYN